MAFTYVLSDSIGKIRLLIMDNQAAAYLFEDDEISAFLSMEGSNLKRTAALAKETIAGNEVYMLKVIELLDLKTDGAAVARELRLEAKELRAQADRDEASEDGGAFDIAEMVVDSFTARQRMANEWLRAG